MNDANFKPSLHVDKFIPEDYSLDSERFLAFLRAYYEWLQTTKITLTGVSGTFVRDELVTGTGGGIGIIKEIGTGYIVIRMTSRLPFNRAETITGGTSDATATVSTIKDNVVRASGNLQNYKNFELSIDKYFEYLQDELYSSLPATVYGDKRLLATKFKQFFESRSNEESYRFLFKLLYDENVEFYYPGEDILRVSDGNFDKPEIIRAVVTSDIFDFLNQTIRGETSGALGNIVDIKVFNLGSTEVAEMTLKLVSGTFQGGEQITNIDNETLTGNTYGMVTGFTINDAGSGYEVGNEVTITGDGSQARVFVSSISDAPISALKVNEIGHGYQLNANAIINNTGTGGSGLAVRVTELANTYTVTSGNNTYTVGEIATVSITNRGTEYIKAPTVTLEDTTISALGLLSAELITIANSGIDYGVGNTLVFTGGSGANAVGQVAAVEESVTYDLLFEDDFRMLSEDSYSDIIKNEDWEVSGPIVRIELTNFGDGYESANLPIITVTSTTGSGANLVATNIQGKSANLSVDIANNAVGIGAIRAVEIRNFGVDYTTANADLTGIGDGNANLTPIISGLGIGDGAFINDDGKIDFKFIQDSFFYQDFSYVIRSGITFNTYKDTIKKIIHPAGLQPFGEILLFDSIDVSPDIVVTITTQQGEIEEILDFIIDIFSLADVSVNAVGNIAVDLVFSLEANLVFSTDKEYIISKFDVKDLTADITNREFEIDFEPSTSNVSISTSSVRKIEILTIEEEEPNFGAYPTFFYQVPINTLASNTILEFSNKTFNDVYESVLGTSSSIFSNIKITGTVTITGNSVIGTSTDFVSDFGVNDSFIVNGEKFIVKSVANTTHMEINVVPTGSYTNVSAYKEQSV